MSSGLMSGLAGNYPWAVRHWKTRPEKLAQGPAGHASVLCMNPLVWAGISFWWGPFYEALRVSICTYVCTQVCMYIGVGNTVCRYIHISICVYICICRYTFVLQFVLICIEESVFIGFWLWKSP